MLSRLFGRAIVCMLIVSGMMYAGCGGTRREPSEPNEVTTSTAATTTADPTASPVKTGQQTPVTTQLSEPQDTKEAATPVPTEVGPSIVPTPIGPTPTIPPVPSRVPPPPPASVAGADTMQSSIVEFPIGVAVVTMNHQGTGQFTVRLQSIDGSFDRIVGSGSGTWKGSKGVIINQAGEYHFAVEAVGSWQIDVQWPTPETAQVVDVPFQQAGTGDQAVYFVVVETGTYTASVTHDGAGNYSVETITSEGRRYISNFHGTGQSSASTEFSVRGKAFEFLLFNVNANGNWTIQVNPQGE